MVTGQKADCAGLDFYAVRSLRINALDWSSIAGHMGQAGVAGRLAGFLEPDGAILSIAYDHVIYQNRPEAWTMRLVLGISTVLGLIGPVAAFLLFYIANRLYHLDSAPTQTLMYLLLSVAGQLTIYLARTRGPFWSIRPAGALVFATLGAQIVATLISVYGVFMAALGWGLAGFVWAYAVAWFRLTDRLKRLAYRIFDPARHPLLEKSPRQPLGV